MGAIPLKDMIRLELFDEQDFDRLISWIDSEELLIQFAGPIFNFPLTRNQLELYISDQNRFPFKVIDSETDMVIGHSEVYDTENKGAKLCRILVGDKNLRGQGLGEKIVTRLVEFAFNKLCAKQIELNVYDWNISAIKCYEKVGFVIEPFKDQVTQFNNKKWTSINMTLDKVIWEKSKSKN